MISRVPDPDPDPDPVAPQGKFLHLLNIDRPYSLIITF